MPDLDPNPPAPTGKSPARPAVPGGRGWRLRGRHWLLARWQALLVLLTLLALTCQLQAQGVDLNALRVQRTDSGLALEYSARLNLNPTLEEALHRGVPIYFVAQATVYRGRWYWRDERVSRVTRSWRVAFQPLTSSWRVSLGGLSQIYGSLGEALAPLSSMAGWRIADADRLDAGERYYVDFSFKLDHAQLPPPLQIDIGSDWKLGIERMIRLE